MENRTKKLAKDTGWFAIGSFGSKLVSLLLVPLYTNILSTSQYGVIDIIYTTITLAVPILTLSIYDACFRFVMEKGNNKNSTLSNMVFLVFFSPLLLFLLYPLFCLWLTDVSNYFSLFFAIYCLNSFSVSFSYYLKGIGKTRAFAVQGIIQTLFFAGSNVLLLLVFKFGITGYLISQIIGYSFGLLYMLIFGGIIKDLIKFKLDWPLMKRMLKYCIPLIPASIAWWIMSSIDRYMILYMCGSDANGLYSAAHKIPTIVTTLTSFFVSAWQISSIENKGEKNEELFVSSLYSVLIILGFFFSGIIIIFSRLFGFVFFAKDFYSAWRMIPSLTVSTFFSTLSLFIGAQFTSEKRSDLHLKSNIISMVSNVVFNLIFITCFGVAGAAIGTMLSFFVNQIYRNHVIKRIENIVFDGFKMYYCSVLIMLLAIIPIFTDEFYEGIALIVFLAICYIYHKEMKSIALICFKKFKRKKEV